MISQTFTYSSGFHIISRAAPSVEAAAGRGCGPDSKGPDLRGASAWAITSIHQLNSVQNLCWLMISLGIILTKSTQYIGDYDNPIEGFISHCSAGEWISTVPQGEEETEGEERVNL